MFLILWKDYRKIFKEMKNANLYKLVPFASALINLTTSPTTGTNKPIGRQVLITAESRRH
jgi:hypothetical protein